ncbi:MAG: hypothetical protein HYV27_02235 [Candidatus Hydrogenedentes bacterium]|nr:hypothetical protein [Candidatus Hydrogenedentota bacterium]
MYSLYERLLQELAAAKDCLLDAGLLLQRQGGPEAEVFPQADRLLSQCHGNVVRAARMATLARPSVLQPYDAQQLFQSQAAHLTASIRSSFIAADTRAGAAAKEGDPEQILCGLQVLLHNIPLAAQGMVQIHLFCQGPAARIAAHYDGLRSYPEALMWEEAALCTRGEIAGCWMRATGGGVLALEGNPLLFPLTGDSEAIHTGVPERLTSDAAVLNGLVRQLRPWRGAIGGWDPGYASVTESTRLYLETIARCMREINGVLGRGEG